MLLAFHSDPHLCRYLRCSDKEVHDISDTPVWSKQLCLQFQPFYRLPPSFSPSHKCTYTSREVRLFEARGSFKAQVHSWKSRHMENKVEHAGPLLAAAHHKVHSTNISRSEKTNVEWNRIMCTLHKHKPVGIKVFRGIHPSKRTTLVLTNGEECCTDTEYSWFSFSSVLN